MRGARGASPGDPVRRRRIVCLAMLVITVPLGLVWRMAPLHLPPFALKYGGSALWAIAVYWLVGSLLPRKPPGFVALVAAVVALTVECGKLIFWPPLDRFRETLAGKLLLGRYFTFGAIVAYWIAIGLVMLADVQGSRRQAVQGGNAPDHARPNTLA